MMIWVDPNTAPEVRHKILDDYARNMQLLISCPGWIQMEAYLKQEEEQALQALEKSVTGDMALKAVSAYTAIRRLRKLPESSLKGAVEALKEFQKK